MNSALLFLVPDIFPLCRGEGHARREAVVVERAVLVGHREVAGHLFILMPPPPVAEPSLVPLPLVSPPLDTPLLVSPLPTTPTLVSPTLVPPTLVYLQTG